METFDILLVKTFNEKFGDFSSVDNLLHHPSDALRFVEEIGGKVGLQDIPPNLVLARLTAIRKSGEFKRLGVLACEGS